ncbi:MAG: GYF domain-containing protein [Pseudomonadota bacterium]
MDAAVKYFISINGTNAGPLDYNDVVMRIKAELLDPDDYIFVAGNKSWSLLKERPEFQSFIDKAPSDEEKEWYVRLNKQNFGPLYARDVRRLLESGSIDLYDYVWKKGCETWLQIKDAKEIKND